MTRLVFTRHAVERYIQFHLLDRDEQTTDWRDVLQDLDAHAGEARRLEHLTRHGHAQWRIDALGCDIVTKHDEGIDVVVTILPPQPFRGLTPEQAERVAASAEAARVREAQLATEQGTLKNKQAKATAKSAPPELRAQANKHNDRLAELKHERAVAALERDLLLTLLRTTPQPKPRPPGPPKAVRHIAHMDAEIAKIKAALRIALRYLRTQRAAEVLAAIAEVDPGLASDRFIDWPAAKSEAS